MSVEAASCLALFATTAGASFVLGSIPFGLLVARVFHVDNLTERGSGNIGASNVSRVVGFWPAGFATFVLDLLKGVLPVFLLGFQPFLGLIESFTGKSTVDAFLPWMAGFFAVLGHCFSPWLRFRGGKGVASGFGALLVLSPISACVGILFFGWSFYLRRIASLSSTIGLVAASVIYLVLTPANAGAWWGAAIVFLILYRHERNIDSLLDGKEKSFG
jgi:glycerol-3-phosphate acyltransferase PlsY